MRELFTSSIGRKIIMAVTGMLLCLFIIAHALGNATAYFGRDAYNSYAAHLHALGPILAVMEIILAAVFLIHIVFGAILYAENTGARGTSYKSGKRDLAQLPARTMPLTGSLILFFIILHYLELHAGNPADTAARVRLILTTMPAPLIYLMAISAVFLHISHGLWSLLQTLGINLGKYDRALRRGSFLTALIIGVLLIMLPILALTINSFLL